MAYHVRVSARAKRDLAKILDWPLKEDAEQAGVQWWLALQHAIASFENNLRRCALAPEGELANVEIRHLLYGRKLYVYRILFTVRDDTVTVPHIRHGRQLPLRLQ